MLIWFKSFSHYIKLLVVAFHRFHLYYQPMTSENSADYNTNWIDPDILAYEDGRTVSYDLDKEREFKEFFETGWLHPKYNDIREHWDRNLKDESAHARVLAKTALWSLVQLRAIQEKLK